MKTRSEARAEKKAPAGNPDAPKPAATATEVERLSTDLAEAMGTPLAPAPPKNPFQWPNANQAKDRGLREDLVRLVETIWVDDIHSTWKELEKALELGEKRSEHAHVIRALDKAGKRADRAYRLYLTAKLARDKWEAENESVWGGMWSKATASLQHEKDTGVRSKQITDADVKARVATLYPDEYRAQEERRRSVELTVRALERLADIYLSKMRNLDSHTGKLRG